MATRQYIGARYVPVLADPTEWSALVPYEALTIVTYLNNSYTSRKPVPAGTLPTNTAYWALTGNYNAQVEEYRQATVALSGQVSTYKNEVDSYHAEVDGYHTEVQGYHAEVQAYNDKVNSYLKPVATPVVFLGDSFMSGYQDDAPSITGFSLIAAARLGLVQNTDFFNNPKAGGGFIGQTDNLSYLNQFKEIESTLPLSKIRSIFVVGGTNDGGLNITTPAANFFAYVKGKCPNATIYVGYDGFPSSGELAGNTAAAYKDVALKNGAAYLEGFKTALAWNDRPAVGYHPGVTGQSHLADCLESYMQGVEFSSYFKSTPTFTPSLNMTQTENFSGVIFYARKDVLTMWSPNGAWIASGLSTIAANGKVKLGDFGFGANIIGRGVTAPFPCIAQATDLSKTFPPLCLGFENNALYLYNNSAFSVQGISTFYIPGGFYQFLTY